MERYKIVYSKQAIKDADNFRNSSLKDKIVKLIRILEVNPFQNPPRYEKLLGDLKGAYSRRINVQHRLVYEVLKVEKIVKILKLWTHYE
ncbi:MAG TPA: Txe/YoeB family addiction module toxin [Clostridiales bacterium]|nr:MAG: toxin of toxin-antitoxin system [Clostridiales bacterium GWD2_32_59]HAN09855.1 Txe/YoeB family addiction module toxin [Clostridiales bacterium]